MVVNKNLDELKRNQEKANNSLSYRFTAINNQMKEKLQNCRYVENQETETKQLFERKLPTKCWFPAKFSTK